MVAMSKGSDPFPSQLEETLREGLKTAGIEAKIWVRKVPTTRLHRVEVLAPKFKSLRPSERQDLVWRIVSVKFPKPEDQLRISMILTLTPDELRGK